MTEGTINLFTAILDLISIVILITFLFRLLKVDYYNPLVQGMLKFADIFTSLIRSIIKPIFRIDLASLIAAAVLQALCFYLISLSGAESSPESSADLFNYGIMISWSLFSVLLLELTIFKWALIGGVVISLVAPASPSPPSKLLLQISDQICKPFRSFLPLTGGLDFSPFLAIVSLYFLSYLVSWMATGVGIPDNSTIGNLIH